MASRSCTAALLLALVAACEPAEIPERFSVSDSLGITIAVNGLVPEEEPVRVLLDEPTHEITGEELFQIRAIQLLNGGEIAVGAAGSAEVLIYDRSAELVLRFGRAGDGPGEFRRISEVVALPGDSIGVYDGQPHRLNVFSRSGAFGRLVDLSGLVPTGGSAALRALDDGPVLVGFAGLSAQRAEGVYRNAAPSYQLDWEGNVLQTYGEFPGLEVFNGAGMMGRVPFGATLSVATSGTHLIVGTGEEPELKVFTSDGALTRIIRWGDTDRTVGQSQIDAYIAHLLAESPPEEATFFRERAASMPFATRRPAFSQLLAAPDGPLWVGEHVGPETPLPGRRGPSRRWLVFSLEGEFLERIETPEGFVPHALDDDRVWGVYRDSLDVESIRAYGVSGS